MKLHLPLSLRSCLLALFATVVAVPSVQADYSYTSNKYYYSGGHKPKAYDLWDLKCGYTTVTAPSGKSFYIDNITQVRYEDIFAVTSTHNCVFNSNGNCTAGVVYTSGIYINMDGNGSDISWNCSEENAPGMWILAGSAHSTQENPITFTNYGNMVVDGNRQQVVLKKAAKVDNYGEVTEWTYVLKDMVEDAFIKTKTPSGTSSLKQIGMSLYIADTESFTYQNAYTGGEGSLGASGSHFHFNNVKELTFANNEAASKYSGGLVGDQNFSFLIENAENVTFTGNKGVAAIARSDSAAQHNAVTFRDITGTITFENNISNNLFSRLDLTFENVGKIHLNETDARLIYLNAGSSKTSVFTLSNVGSILMENYNRSENEGAFIYEDNWNATIRISAIDNFTAQNNTYARYLLCLNDRSSSNAVTLDSVGVFSVHDNTAVLGRLLSDSALAFINVGSKFSIRENIIGQDATATSSVLSNKVLTVSGQYTTDGNGGIIDKADLFEIDANTATGAYEYGLSAGAINVSYFDAASISKNTYTSVYQYAAEAFVDVLNVEHVDRLQLNDNALKSNGTLDYMVQSLSLSDFKQFELNNNVIKNETGNSFALYHKMTFTTEQEGATVSISGNSITSPYMMRTHSAMHQTLTVSNVDELVVSNNTKHVPDLNQSKTSPTGGILGGDDNYHKTLILNDVKTINFSGNKVLNDSRNGGHVYGATIAGGVNISSFDTFTVSGNSVTVTAANSRAIGGGVYIRESAPSIIEKGDTLLFSDNLAESKSWSRGGGVYVATDMLFKEIKNLTFSGNKAIASAEEGEASGGAFCEAHSYSDVTFTNVENITFKDNVASAGGYARGGAWAEINDSLTMTCSGTLTLSGNKAVASYITGEAKGGAIYIDGTELTLSGMKELIITGNSAEALMEDKAFGGAIYSLQNRNVVISDNGKVTIRGNYVKNGDFVNLQGIHSRGRVYLNAKYEQEITVHDPVYTQNVLYLNGDDKQLGSVTLTGATAEEDLKKIKPEATEAEITASRQHSAYSATVAAGNVSLEGGVSLTVTTKGFTQSGGNLKVDNSSIIVNGGSFEQNAGSLTLNNASILSKGNVKATDAVFSGHNVFKGGKKNGTSNIISGKNWTFNLTEAHKKDAVLTLGAGTTAATYTSMALTLNLAAEKALAGGIYKLLTFDSEEVIWTEANWSKLTLSGLCTSTAPGTAGKDDIYFIVDGTSYTLVYETSFEPRTDAATLTWTAESGTWKQESGLDDGLWSGTVADTNYYNGDSVVFDKAASVALEGELTPADVKVSNEDGSVSFSGSGKLAGKTSLTKSGKGTLEIATSNTYSGGTVIQDGTLKVANTAALGTGGVNLAGGTLDFGGMAVGNDITVDGTASILNAQAATGALVLNSGELSIDSARAGLTQLVGGALVNTGAAATNISSGKVYLKGAKLRGAFDLSGSAGWDVAVDSSIEGSLVLGSGSLTLHNTSLSVSETLTLGAATIVLDGTYTEGNSYTLLSAGSIDGELTSLVLDGITLNYELNIENNALVLNALAIETPDEPGTDVPGGDDPGIVGPGGDDPGIVGPGGDDPGIVGPGGDDPGIVGPGGDDPGIVGPGGDEPGIVGPGGDDPGIVGPGGDDPGIVGPGGDDPGIVGPGGDEPGQLVEYRPAQPVLSQSEVNSNTAVILEGKGTITLNGKVAPGAIKVDSSKSITFKSGKTGGSISGSGDLTKSGTGTLTLNDGNGSWTGDIYLHSGTIKVKGAKSLGSGDVYVQGGTLNLVSKPVGNDIIQTGNAVIKGAKKFTGIYTLESGELKKGSSITISKSAILDGGTLNGTLTGTGSVTITGAVTMGNNARITTRTLNLDDDVDFHSNSKGLVMGKDSEINMGSMSQMYVYGRVSARSMKMDGSVFYANMANKTVAVALKGDMVMKNGAETELNGKFSAVNLSLDNKSQLLMDSNTPQMVTLRGTMSLSGDSEAELTGKLTASNLKMSDSLLSIDSAKPQNMVIKSAATLSNSTVTTNGKLTVGSLTLNNNSRIIMSGDKPQSIKVNGALTIQEGSTIIMDYDFEVGKTYKLITFRSFKAGNLYDAFGVSEEDCVLTNTGTSITLFVNEAWNPQLPETETYSGEKVAVTSAATEEKKPVAAAATGGAEPNPAADALVQANWGQLEASRAFVNAMANRSMAVQLGNGERAVWASAIGSSSRHDTASGHNGADTNVSGGAFGLETQVGRASLFGMALGNSWTRVSAHGFGTIEQDTTHLGIYGQTNWRSGVTADWSAAYGRSESESMGSDWNQKHLQLDGRVSYNHELNTRTLLSPFAGVQYYASDAAGIGTTDTGSLQNLRAEIGVAASHRVGKLGVFGEIAVHQDLARNNPGVSMEGNRYTGMNPGRTGLNFTVGASYELTDKWSVNASYTGEFVENANAHSANVGASYKF